MKKLIAGVLLSVAMLGGAAFADEPAIVNDPPNAWDNFKRAINVVEPSGDVLYSSLDGDFKYGSSIRLYTLERFNVPVVNDMDVRLGWLADQGSYLTLALALDRVTGNPALRYVSVGLSGGRDFQDDEWLLGPTFSAKLTF